MRLIGQRVGDKLARILQKDLDVQTNLSATVVLSSRLNWLRCDPADDMILHPMDARSQDNISITQLTHACAADQHAQTDSGACFELLRRALEDRSIEAWAAFDAQFGALIGYWIQQAAARFALPRLDASQIDEIRTDGISRFVERYGATLSTNFEHIGSALSVLQKCLFSVVQEERRNHERSSKLVSALQQVATEEGRGDLSLANQTILDELRRCIHDQLAQDVPEEHLRLLIELRFGLDLKPREITKHDPAHFPTVDYVNDQIDRLLKRLRRRADIYQQKCL